MMFSDGRARLIAATDEKSCLRSSGDHSTGLPNLIYAWTLGTLPNRKKPNRETNMISRNKLGLAGLAVLTSLSASPHVGRAAITPFTAMAGAWAGGGTMIMSSGMQERLRCRAQYGVGGGG